LANRLISISAWLSQHFSSAHSHRHPAQHSVNHGFDIVWTLFDMRYGDSLSFFFSDVT
jgi:hypothetical protein